MKQTNYSNIPDELIALERWVGYRLEHDEKGSIKKIPINPKTGREAKSNNPKTWSDFTTACEAVENYKLDGIGIMFGDGLCGIDIDDCVIDGKISDLALDIIDTMKSYTEFSPSGTGIHILFFGEIKDNPDYYKKNPHNGIEVYRKRRYFTVTGNIFGGESY